jgi:hypothetical protein
MSVTLKERVFVFEKNGTNAMGLLKSGGGKGPD